MRGKTTGDRHGTCIEGSKHRVCLGEDAVERQHHLIAEPVELHESTAERKRALRKMLGYAPSICQVRSSSAPSSVRPSNAAAVSGYTTFISCTSSFSRFAQRIDPRSPTFATPPAVEDIALGVLAYNDVWYGGFTRNPWNLNERSSGSSAGSAAATAAGLSAASRSGRKRSDQSPRRASVGSSEVDRAALEGMRGLGMDLVEVSLPDLPYARKDWAFAIAKRSTMRKARVALARRLAIIMHAMLRDGTEFVRT
jgi:hypothetical protein